LGTNGVEKNSLIDLNELAYRRLFQEQFAHFNNSNISITGGSFAETAPFMPAIKILIQHASTMNVTF